MQIIKKKRGWAMKVLSKYLFLLAVGGAGYYCIELLYRGHSHWSMFLLGGLCLIICGLINEGDRKYIPLWIQMALSALIITTLEMDFGLIFNIWLHMNIWDYSYRPLNIMGQICPTFTIIWFFLSIIAILADDYIRYWLYGESKPKYIFTLYQLKMYKNYINNIK